MPAPVFDPAFPYSILNNNCFVHFKLISHVLKLIILGLENLHLKSTQQNGENVPQDL